MRSLLAVDGGVPLFLDMGALMEVWGDLLHLGRNLASCYLLSFGVRPPGSL